MSVKQDKLKDENTGWDPSNFDKGYFFKLHKKLGENMGNNLKGFRFKKEVLSQYTDFSKKYPLEFRYEENSAGGIYINHIGKWDMRCYITKKGDVGAILIDLTNIPNAQQKWWEDHLLDKEK